MKAIDMIRRILFRMLCSAAIVATIAFLPFIPHARAATNTAIPRISNTSMPIVVITGDVATGSQAGYATLKAAMEAIGNGTDDYTIVFTQNYTMVPGTDRDATTANAKSASSLTITSTCYAGTSTTPTTAIVQASGGTYASDLNFNAETLIHDFSIRSQPIVHMMANGHPLTIGDNVDTGTGRFQLYGGGDGVVGGDTNLTISSGYFTHIVAGGRNGAVNGTTNAIIQGTAKADNFYAGSQNAASGITGNLAIKGNAVVTDVFGCYNSGSFPDNATVNVELENAANVRNLRPTLKFNGNVLQKFTANVTVKGSSLASGITTATNLTITDNATFSTGTGTGIFGGALTVTGDMTLGSSAAYVHAGSDPTQKVNGNLIVNGTGSKLAIFKKDAGSATLPLTVGGSYTTSNKLDLTLYNNVAAADDDILLTFSTPANASGDDYNTYLCNANLTLFDTVNSSTNPANIVYKTIYSRPIYYQPVPGFNDLFSFIAVGDATLTDGGNHTEYRKLYNNQWYEADASGNIIGSPIDTALDRPQPDPTNYVNYHKTQGTMIRLDGLGFYRITVAVGSNAHGDSVSGINTASGNSANLYNVDGKGAENSSWAILNQTNANCTIKRAFLVMTTTMDNKGNGNPDRTLNTPMKLVAPNGDTMLSNGYLPEGFVVAIPGTLSSTLTSTTPTLLYDRDNSRNDLGEAMTVTDVTDFVKAHGYGKYYGIDIPTDGSIDVDALIGWRLIVIENDTASMEYLRKVSIQLGPISNGSSTEENPIVINLSLGGFTTPGDTATSFAGQVLMIGSDNLIAGRGTKGSNLHNAFYPNPNDNPTERVQIASNDPNTIGIDRPEYYWTQGHADIDGINLSADEVSHITDDANKYVGFDMQLLNVTDTQSTTWANDGEGGGGHNLYLTKYSPGVKLTSRSDGMAGMGYVDTLGLSTDIETPSFTTEITHTDDNTPPLEGVDVPIRSTVIVNGVATNVTLADSSVQGSINTTVVVEVDKKLSDIRDIVATFSSGGIDIPVVGVYDPATHTITFGFGQDFLADDGNTYKLYNTAGDVIHLSFKATTNSTPTINNDKLNYLNTISVYGSDIYKKAYPKGFVHLDEYACYATDDDDFDTFQNALTISKTVNGSTADAAMLFSFELFGQVEAVDGTYHNLPEGYKLSYQLSGSVGIQTMTVDASGIAVFELRHGQSILIEGTPFDLMTVSETNAGDYRTSWTWVGAGTRSPTIFKPDTDVLVVSKTGDSALHFTNEKGGTKPPPQTGDSFPLQALLLLWMGSALLAMIVAFKWQGNNRKR